MASFAGISAAGKSIERLLNACFSEEEIFDGSTPQAVLARTEDLVSAGGGSPFSVPTISIYLYRVDFNKTMRAAWSAVGSADGISHLPLDLHFLLTAWATNAEHEHLLLGKAMECLETTPILSGPLLYQDPEAKVQWAPTESLQVVLEELSTEAVMRTFDSLPVDYKLSVPYIARIMRMDGKAAHSSPTVVQVRQGLTPRLPR